MSKIADVFFQALLDDSRLQLDVEKSGQKAGETLGTRMAGGISTKLRAGLAVISAGAALATKGVLELDDATAQYVADTGASADEADRARKAILAMSSRNIQPIREIGKVLSTVRTDMGLTGDEAEKTAESFLRFARVTGRDAAEEVHSFDDLLDAWGLTARDATGIMDKLTASHQKYGGSVVADEEALKLLAPAMKALNFDVDDTIALLDLFKTKGLDAADTTRAFNTAALKLPKGTNLKEFIAHLAAIPDPGQRAAEAVRVFGSRGGVALANALGPGIGSLDDFRITAEEATGATYRAREAIDSTFGNRVQLLLKQFGAKIIEVGQNFGPLLTGFAGLTTAATALGLDRFVATFVAKLAEAGRAGGSALIDAAQTATGAAGTIIGNTIAQPIIDVLDPDKNSLLGRTVRGSSAKLGAIWGAIFGGATKLANALIDLFVGLPGIGRLRAVVLASAIELGSLQGTAMGAAASTAFSLALIVGLPVALATVGPKIADDLQHWFNRTFFNNVPTTGDTWDQWKKEFEHNGQDAGGLLVSGVVDGMAGFQGKVTDDLHVATNAITQNFGELANNPTLGQVREKLIGVFHDIAVSEGETAGAAKRMRDDVVNAFIGMEDAAHALNDVKLQIDEKLDELDQLDKDHTDNLKKETKRQTDEYHRRRIQILDQLNALKLEAALSGDDMHKTTALIALLTSADLKKNLTSKDPDIKAAASSLQAYILAQLGILATNGGPAAARAAAAIGGKFNPTGTGPMSVTKLGNYGARAFEAYVDGLAPKTLPTYVTRQITNTLSLLAAHYRATSPPGPLSPLHLIDVWGERTGETFMVGIADGVMAGIRRVRAALAPVAAAMTIGTPALAGISAPDAHLTGLDRARQVANSHAAFGLATAGAHVGPISINVDASGHRNPAEVGRAVHEAVGDAIASVLRDQTYRTVGGRPTP